MEKLEIVVIIIGTGKTTRDCSFNEILFLCNEMGIGESTRYCSSNHEVIGMPVFTGMGRLELIFCYFRFIETIMGINLY